MSTDARTSEREALDRKRQAHHLAAKHYEIEPGMKGIYWVVSSHEEAVDVNEPVKLLEINENTIPAGIQPLHFSAAPMSGIPYPTVIIEVTPNEFVAIENREIPLPEGWTIKMPIQRPQ